MVATRIGKRQSRCQCLVSPDMNGKTALKNGHTEKNGHAAKNGVERKKTSLPVKIPAKQFVARESLFTELFRESQHIRSLYHLALAAVIVLALDAACRGGGGPRAAAAGFIGLATVTAPAWAGMMATALAVHPLAKGGGISGTCTASLLLIPALGVAPIMVVVRAGTALGMGSRLVILFEQTRLLMKTWAYLKGCREGKAGTFKHYLYFLFVPTLLYRKEYPRTTAPIKLGAAIWHALEVLGCVFVFAYTLERLMLPAYGNFGGGELGPRTAWRTFAGAVLPASILLVTGHFLLLHAWMNCWSELLRFADRKFYSDWWCSSSYTDYYRRWNVVVHDWLHEHVYSVCLSRGSTRAGAAVAVFAVSAAVHEYIIGLALGFFYPVMLIQFGIFGAALAFIRTGAVSANAGNVFLWLSLTTGTGIQFSLYALEYFARQNCPQLTDGSSALYAQLLPRSWFC